MPPIRWYRAARTAPAKRYSMRERSPTAWQGTATMPPRWATTRHAVWRRRQGLAATTRIGLTNRERPPDAILCEVSLRTGHKPFAAIDDVISRAELNAMSDGYKRISDT